MYDLELLLSRVYNTLSTIDTHGEATIRMASCLETLGEIIQFEANKKLAPPSESIDPKDEPDDIEYSKEK